MYIDDYGNEFETREKARKFYEKKFDTKMNSIDEFIETLSNFADLGDVIEFLYNRDKTVLEKLKTYYANELAEERKRYAEEWVYFLDEV